MSFWVRLLHALGIRAGHVMGGAEDPRRALDLAFARQLDLLAQLRRGVADVVTARKRIELQTRQLTASPDRLEDEARLALQEGRHEAARETLLRRAVIRGELGELERQSSILAGEEARLMEASKRLELQVQQFRIRRETVQAAYVAARARANVSEVLARLAQDDAELRLAVDQAERRIAETRARTAALDGLLAGGGNDPPVADAEAAAELARLEGDLLWGREELPPPSGG